MSVDATRISLCIVNVVSNSARYTEAGGEIRIECRAGPGLASIVISDTGVGISAEFLPKVFDLFSQAGKSLDRSQGGLGLGMYICREFIQMHGGTVTAASAGAGLGSTFTIRLPLCDAPYPRYEPTIAGPLQLKRVLIVDDNTDAADSLAELLQMSGHQISAVYSAERGLIEIERFQPHVVLLDIGLPHMDGYEVARRIKQLGSSARLIALSGYGQAQDKQRAAQAGFDAHLTKPVDFRLLELELEGHNPSS